VTFVLPRQQVTVAEAGGNTVGFIAVSGEWVEQLYLDPTWTGQGIGSLLLMEATATLPVVKLHCFQSNAGARRFYERHGFSAGAFGDGPATRKACRTSCMSAGADSHFAQTLSAASLRSKSSASSARSAGTNRWSW
jgi:hypothetical protein